MCLSGVGEAENMRKEAREVCCRVLLFPLAKYAKIIAVLAPGMAVDRIPGSGFGVGGSTETDAPKLSPKTWLPLQCRGGGW